MTNDNDWGPTSLYLIDNGFYPTNQIPIGFSPRIPVG